jgi:hypothetical protein
MRFAWPYLAALALVPLPCHAKPKPAPVASPEIVARFHAAHSIFVTSGEPELHDCLPYQGAYQAIAAWPGVTMADLPSHAEVVLQIEAFATTTHQGQPPERFIRIRLIDPATQDVWSTYLDDIVDLYCTAAVRDALSYFVLPNPNPKPLKISAPVPVQMHPGSKLYIQQEVALVPSARKPEQTPAPLDFDLPALLAQAIASSGLYTIVDSAASADLIITATFQPFDPWPSPSPGSVTMHLLDPATKTQLWQQENDLLGNLNVTTNKDRFEKALPNIVKDLKSYATKGHL